jgi:hypothetical protein
VTSIADATRTTTSNFALSADPEKKRRQIGFMRTPVASTEFRGFRYSCSISPCARPPPTRLRGRILGAIANSGERRERQASASAAAAPFERYPALFVARLAGTPKPATRGRQFNDIKSKAWDLALSQIEKQFGKGSIMNLGEQAIEADIPVIPTGSLGLDLALGVGGLPRGRVVEIYGPESSGKTTLALECIAEAQKRGGVCAFIDAEHALDASYARKLGVSVEDLLISQPDNGEQALEITETLVQSGAIDVVVIDSVAALVPRAENLS